jgi:hypothetical protein
MSASRKWFLPAGLVLCVAGLTITTSVASATHPRPKSAKTITASLTPAYSQCTAPTHTHGPPLAFPSCNQPQPASDHLTLGTPDNNGWPLGFEGAVQYKVSPGNPATPADEADVRVKANLWDIRNQSGLTDYTGELLVRSVLRITDRLNGPNGNERGTVQDVPFAVAVPCAATPESAGSACSVSTTLDAVTPGAVPEGKRSVWELGSVEVYDGGADGQAETAGNTLFARQGVFVP